MGEEVAGYLEGRIDAIREHLVALAASAPTLPAEFARVNERLMQEWQTRGPGAVLGLIAGFLALGFAVEAIFCRAIREKPHERLPAIGGHFGREIGAVAAFAVGSTAVFLAFSWPAQTRAAVLGFLVAFIAVRLVVV